MRISVIGCGYLGAVHAVCMASLGHDVIGVDIDAAKIEKLSRGEAPFFEPGFAPLLREALAGGRIRFAAASPDVLRDVDVHFITVGTPQSDHSAAANTDYVFDAVEMVKEAVSGVEHAAVIVGKSTVPVGTAESIARIVEPLGISLVWNPEFLRESKAVHDTLHPDRIVYGLSSDPVHADRAKQALDTVYAPLLANSIPLVVTSFPTAELVKVAANGFLATKISYINAMAQICERTGGDVSDLARAVGLDERIGSKFLRAGVGFGGGCLPKDIRAFAHRAAELGVDGAVGLLRQVDSINLGRRTRVIALAQEILGERFEGAKIAVLGAAFKPNSDDIRDSPALEVAMNLQDMGANVVVTDPKALENVRRNFPALSTVASAVEALEGADLVIVLTEWAEYIELDPARAAALVANRVVIDGRLCLDAAAWANAGWQVHSLGRPVRRAEGRAE